MRCIVKVSSVLVLSMDKSKKGSSSHFRCLEAYNQESFYPALEINPDNQGLRQAPLPLVQICYLSLLTALVNATCCAGAMAQTNILNSRSNSFTFQNCVSNICVQSLDIVQQRVSEFVPASCNFPPRDSNGWGGYGCTNVPAHTDTFDRAIVVANVSFPSCNNQYHLEGVITVKYRNGDANITRSHTIERSDENRVRRLEWLVRGYYGDPSMGTASISGSSTCVWHGVRNSPFKIF